MTLCSSQARQAGFEPRPSFQDTTCFVNKIRDADRRTQKEQKQEPAHQLCSPKQLGRLLMSSFHTASFPFPPTEHLLRHVLLLSFLHASLPVSSSLCFLRSIQPLHAPSVFVSLRRSFSLHVPHFYDSLVSLRQINPRIYCQAGVVYHITVMTENIIKDY